MIKKNWKKYLGVKVFMSLKSILKKTKIPPKKIMKV